MDYYKRALELHEKYRGKIDIKCDMPLNNREDLAVAYTPGVAQPCLEIAKDPANAYKYTSKSHLVAIVTDGSAVLGLGNIGGMAGMPVMEGKAALFKAFGGVDGFPICLSTQMPGFIKPENYLKNAEMAMEDDYGMIDGIINNGPRKTVTELEEQSKTGKPISLLELAQAVQREDEEKRRAQQPVRREKSGEKPSILAKLKALPVKETKSLKSAPKRSAEREL